ncbi:MAG: hypothetical protein AAF483_05240 [Planctomycetota bacterium]
MGNKVKWGFDWPKVGSGALMFLGGGAVALAGYLGGSISRLTIGAAVVALIGLFTMASGLMGEDGVW